jgi:hypothetical protein
VVEENVLPADPDLAVRIPQRRAAIAATARLMEHQIAADRLRVGESAGSAAASVTVK